MFQPINNNQQNSAALSINQNESVKLYTRILDQINNATVPDQVRIALKSVHNSDQATLSLLSKNLLERLKDKPVPRFILEKLIMVGQGLYTMVNSTVTSSNNTESCKRVFLSPALLRLIIEIDPRADEKQIIDKKNQKEILGLGGEFKKEIIFLHRAGKITDHIIENHAGLALHISAILIHDTNVHGAISPLNFWNLFSGISKGAFTMHELLELSSLAWCEYSRSYSEIINMPFQEKSVESRSQISLSKLSAPINQNFSNLPSSRCIQSDYCNAFPDDTPTRQFERIISQRSFESFIDIIRSGCPIEIPNSKEELIRPLSYVEKRFGEQGQEPYLSAQVVWAKRQIDNQITLFIARYHTLHRASSDRKCPTMRVTRIVPHHLSTNEIEPRQFLIDRRNSDVFHAIRSAKLEKSVCSDLDGNIWLSVRHLEDFVITSQPSHRNSFLDPASILLSATHFPYFSKRMLELPKKVASESKKF